MGQNSCSQQRSRPHSARTVAASHRSWHPSCNGLLLLLQERSAEAEQLQREREQRAKQATQAQGELARQATMIQQLQVQLRRAREAPAGSISAAQVGPPAPDMSSSAALLRCHQEEVDALSASCIAACHCCLLHMVPGSSGQAAAMFYSMPPQLAGSPAACGPACSGSVALPVLALSHTDEEMDCAPCQNNCPASETTSCLGWRVVWSNRSGVLHAPACRHRPWSRTLPGRRRGWPTWSRSWRERRLRQQPLQPSRRLQTLLQPLPSRTSCCSRCAQKDVHPGL